MRKLPPQVDSSVAYRLIRIASSVSVIHALSEVRFLYNPSEIVSHDGYGG
jgi:hypothetical protein